MNFTVNKKNLIYDIVFIGGSSGIFTPVMKKRWSENKILVLFDKDGQEVAKKSINVFRKLKIEYKLGTMVFGISRDKVITAVNPQDGVFHVEAKTIIMG